MSVTTIYSFGNWLSTAYINSSFHLCGMLKSVIRTMTILIKHVWCISGIFCGGSISSKATYKQNSSLNRRKCCRRGLNELKSGRRITSGHTAGVGVPHIRLISSSWISSWFDWNSGFFVNNSPRMHLRTQNKYNHYYRQWRNQCYTTHSVHK